jgi:polysaccharide biosynthesis/export protein
MASEDLRNNPFLTYYSRARGAIGRGWGLMTARIIGTVGVMGLFVLSAGCTILPGSGPSLMDVASEAASPTPEGGYMLLDITERIVSISSAQPRESFKRVFTDVGPSPDLRIGVSDSVVVTIWEAGAGGLFSASPTDRSIASGSRTATIPEQVVARDGTIQVPYAGRLHVAGLRPGDVEQLVVRALQGKAIEPQAVVTISKNLSNTVTLGGEVVNGARVALSTKGDRLLDVIAGAGGIRISANEAFLRLTRRKQTVSVSYNGLLNHPEENIYVLPGDVITVVRDPQTFTAFGATGRSEKIPFDTAGITLEEAIARAGGLNDFKADPGGVFLLRFEPTPLVAQFVPNAALPPGGNLVPVIYRLNLRDAHSFFLARSFAMKDKDIIYIANSASDQIGKFLGLVGLVTSPVISGVATYGAVK